MTCPADCFIPADWHWCWGSVIPEHKCFGDLTHQHRPKKGMGGNNPNSKIVAILCLGIHDQVDSNAGRPYRDEVVKRGSASGSRMFSAYYRLWDDVVYQEHGREMDYAPVWIDITEWIGASAGVVSTPQIETSRPSAGALTEYGPGEDYPTVGDVAVASPGPPLEGEGDERDAVIGIGGVGVRGGVINTLGGYSGESGSGEGGTVQGSLVGTNRNYPVGSVALVAPLSILEPLPPDLSFEEWEAVGRALGSIRAAAQWRIGEWCLYGERHYGEKYSQAIESTGLSYSRLASITSTVGAFETLPVAATLSFSVIEVIAPVMREQPQMGAEMVSTAKDEGWTVEDARMAVAASRGLPLVEPETVFCDMGYRHKRREA